MSIASTFPVRLKLLRRTAGVTQPELAAALGVHKSLAGHWETGMCQPNLTHLVGMTKVLGCSLEALMVGNADTLDMPGEPVRQVEPVRYGLPLPAKERGCPIAFGIAVQRMSAGSPRVESWQ
jgi:transcriptional regulator with XRE-family HTH domain